jgi:hypothetical protein
MIVDEYIFDKHEQRILLFLQTKFLNTMDYSNGQYRSPERHALKTLDVFLQKCVWSR